MIAVGDRFGPNDLMPCGTQTAKRRHLAKGEECDTCGTSPWTTGVVNGGREHQEVAADATA